MGNLYLLTHKVKIRLGHLGHPIAPWRTRNGAVQIVLIHSLCNPNM